MKKILLIIAAMAMCMAANSCSKGGAESGASSSTEVSEAEAADEVTFNGGVVYENEKFGFSVSLPEGFHPQNDDKQMEEERGGKVYINQGCMVDMQASDQSSKVTTVKESLEMDAAFITVDEAKGEKLLQKDVKDDELIAKWTDQFGYRALYYKYVGKTKYEIAFTYGTDRQKEFEEEVDKIIKSLKYKK